MIRTGTTLATAIATALLVGGAVLGSGSSIDNVAGGKALLIRIAQVDASAAPDVVGGTVRLGDEQVSFAEPVTDTAVTDGGLYVLAGKKLWVTDFHARLQTGVSGMDHITASPDGRYLGFVDLTTTHTDRHGTSLAVVTVYDTTTGERVVHSADGMGDPGHDDLARLYRDDPPSFVGFDGDGTAYVRPADRRSDFVALPTDGGDPRRVDGTTASLGIRAEPAATRG
ncbi:MAG TPA: hypothetical protein VFK34_00490 [Marmoricola sp.]|nr:hypothetical protein [Marmoricola sp.]